MNIHKVGREDFQAWLDMGLLLWPEESEVEIKKYFETILGSEREEAFVYRDEDGAYIGFINVSIRHEYVPGAVTFPVGYVEGIYVRPEYRRQGTAKRLLEQGEKWAAERGCVDMASDALLQNKDSQAFHKKVGFRVVETSVHFIKKIGA